MRRSINSIQSLSRLNQHHAVHFTPVETLVELKVLEVWLAKGGGEHVAKLLLPMRCADTFKAELASMRGSKARKSPAIS
jgi:hypothetical protein